MKLTATQNQLTLTAAGPNVLRLSLAPVVSPVLNLTVSKTVVVQLDGGALGGHYTHNQAVPAATWSITHNLGYNPAGIQAFDSAGSAWWPNVIYVDNNTLTLNFGTASFAGKAYLS